MIHTLKRSLCFMCVEENGEEQVVIKRPPRKRLKFQARDEVGPRVMEKGCREVNGLQLCWRQRGCDNP